LEDVTGYIEGFSAVPVGGLAGDDIVTSGSNGISEAADAVNTAAGTRCAFDDSDFRPGGDIGNDPVGSILPAPDIV